MKLVTFTTTETGDNLMGSFPWYMFAALADDQAKLGFIVEEC